MFLGVAHKIYTELPVSENVKFSTKDVLLPKQSLADQCKCMIHENFINKLRVLSILCDSSSFWETVLCNNTTNSKCWQENSENCADDKNVRVNFDLGKNFLQRIEVY